MINQKANPLLIQTEQKVREGLPPESVSAFERIVTAGVKVLDSEQSQKLVVEQLKIQADPADIAGAGVAKLMGVLISESKGSMLSKPVVKATMSAATVLLCESLDRMEELGMIQVTNDTLSAAMQSMSSAILQMLGATPEKLGAMAKAKGQQMPEMTPAPTEQPPQPLIGAQ